MKIEHKAVDWQWLISASSQREYEALKYLMEALELKWGTPGLFSTDAQEEGS